MLAALSSRSLRAPADAQGSLPGYTRGELGTNDDPNMTDAFRSAIRETMEVAGERCVVWVNIYRPAVAGTNYDGYNRVLIEESVGRKNLRVVDWHGLVSLHPEWLGPDGVHVNAAGYQARAEALARALRGCGNPEEAPDAAASAASLTWAVPYASRRSSDVLTALLDAWEPDAEAAAELGDALGLHVQGVATAELAEDLRVRRPPAASGASSAKNVSKPAGEMISRIRGTIAGVPERVPLTARLVDQVARSRLDDLVPEQRAHPALEDEAVLVLAVVSVQRRREPARRHRVLDEAEAGVAVSAGDHEADADGLQLNRLAVGRADDRRGSGRGHVCSLLDKWLNIPVR